ncbi:MAG: hypothetical protein LC775_01780 [Acidobacteria bacterium]|nr:hypothetical protein [Acidobacteriota bacterium]
MKAVGDRYGRTSMTAGYCKVGAQMRGDETNGSIRRRSPRTNRRLMELPHI